MPKSKNHVILYEEKVGSTNDFLKAMLKEGYVGDPVFLIAGEQTQGRGQFERMWLSKENKGLYLSYLFFPERHYVETITKETAILLVELLKQYQVDAHIKIPNDILVGNRKIAGILTESLFRGEICLGVVVGIGLNLFYERRELEEEGILGTSLAEETGMTIDHNSITQDLIEVLLKLNMKKTEDIEKEFDGYKV